MALLFLSAILACNAPSISAPEDPSEANPQPDAQPDTGAATEPGDENPAPQQPTVPSGIDEDLPAEPVIIPDVPEGWSTFESSALALSLAYPGGWDAQPVNEEKLDIIQQNSDAWIEFILLDEETADDWSLTFEPDADPTSVIDTLITASSQDGEYGSPRIIQTRGGSQVAVADGQDNLFSERILIGVLTRTENWLLIIGHGTEDLDTWEDLLPVYEGIIASFEAR